MRHAGITSIVIIAAAAGIAAAGLRLTRKSEPPFQMPEHLTCVLKVSRRITEADGYAAGYCYDLLKRFATDNGCGIDIMVAQSSDNWADSLAAGCWDIVAMTLPGDGLPDSLSVTAPVDSMALWIVSPRMEGAAGIIDRWLEDYYSSEEYPALHRAFSDGIGNPHIALARRVRREHLSPYDSLIRRYSAEIGWDWRMLAALIWQESHFHIEVMSSRGAAGLMQIAPSTADRYELEDLLDPEENIRTGVRHLSGLQRMFRRRVDGREELHKITLAAYNAGPGHIKDALDYADLTGSNGRDWDTVVSMLPALSDSSIVAQTDTIKHGVFKGVETVNYVDSVLEMYDVFRQLCPDGQPTRP